MKKGDKVRYRRPLNRPDAEREFTLVENPTHPTVYIEDQNHTVELVSIDEIEVVESKASYDLQQECYEFAYNSDEH